jgi:hypothetical protein
MFNFIFDSSLGNILAPVKSAICQFHLAIQHNRKDEVITVLIYVGVLHDRHVSVYAVYAVCLCMQCMHCNNWLMTDDCNE